MILTSLLLTCHPNTLLKCMGGIDHYVVQQSLSMKGSILSSMKPRSIDQSVKQEMRGQVNRQLILFYFHSYRVVPKCTWDESLEGNPDAKNLIDFLTRDPNTAYKYALVCPPSLWAKVKISEPIIDTEDPIDFFNLLRILQLAIMLMNC